MGTKSIDLADNFYEMIKNLNPRVKLELISRITNSLKEDEGDPEKEVWKSLFGAWTSDESAEELIEESRANRYTNRKMEDL